MNNYVYLLEDPSPESKARYYIGVRTCACPIGCDPYKGSVTNRLWKAKWKEISSRCTKIILGRFSSREEALAYEVELHSKFNVASNEEFYNQANQTSKKFDITGKKFSLTPDQIDKMKNTKIGKKQFQLIAANTRKVKCIELGKTFDSFKEAAIHCSTNSTSISKVLAGKRKTAGGYHWERM